MKRTFRTSRRDVWFSEGGSVSVEFVLWVPVIVAAMLLVTDVTLTFLAHASMWSTAGDLSRALAMGRLGITDAQAFVDAQTKYTLFVSSQDGFVAVELSRPFAGIGTGMTLSFVGDLRVQVIQHIQPGVSL